MHTVKRPHRVSSTSQPCSKFDDNAQEWLRVLRAGGQTRVTVKTLAFISSYRPWRAGDQTGVTI